MKKLFFLTVFTVSAILCKGQAPADVHYQQNKSMNITPTNNRSYIYSWVDSNKVKHLKRFYIGQVFIEKDEYGKMIWKIYEIDIQGVWYYGIGKRDGDGYRAFETFEDDKNIKFLTK